MACLSGNEQLPSKYHLSPRSACCCITGFSCNSSRQGLFTRIGDQTAAFQKSLLPEKTHRGQNGCGVLWIAVCAFITERGSLLVGQDDLSCREYNYDQRQRIFVIVVVQFCCWRHPLTLTRKVKLFLKNEKQLLGEKWETLRKGRRWENPPPLPGWPCWNGCRVGNLWHNITLYNVS